MVTCYVKDLLKNSETLYNIFILWSYNFLIAMKVMEEIILNMKIIQ